MSENNQPDLRQKPDFAAMLRLSVYAINSDGCPSWLLAITETLSVFEPPGCQRLPSSIIWGKIKIEIGARYRLIFVCDIGIPNHEKEEHHSDSDDVIDGWR